MVQAEVPVLVVAGVHAPNHNDTHADFAFDIEETVESAYSSDQDPIKNDVAAVDKTLPEKENIAKRGGIVLRAVPICIGAYVLASLAALKVIPNSATLIIGCCLAVIGVTLLFYHIHDRSRAFALLLGTVAFTIIAGCEAFYLKDIFSGGPALRMNTVFKFYFQAWALLSIASGVGLFFILQSFRPGKTMHVGVRWARRGVVGIWSVLLLILVLASMVYPIIAPYARYSRVDASHALPYMTTNLSLDGSAYLATCSPPVCAFATAGDYKAIQWLNDHVQGDPVIVEASGNDYSYSSRISTFTGLPTLMGWVGHEIQWRINWVKQGQAEQADFDSRIASIDTMYTNPDPSIVLATMAQYNVQYLYVGTFERNKYPKADLMRFSTFMRIAYNVDGVTIFQVK
jgi:uncharacterized membrane protein